MRATSRLTSCFVYSALSNTDDGAPMTPIGASAAASQADAFLATAGARAGTGGKRTDQDGDSSRAHAKAYQGGSYRHLHSMLGVSSGAQVLYVGDHIYGDILRSKKTLGWRTMLVVPELAHEMECLEVAAETDTPVRFFLSSYFGNSTDIKCFVYRVSYGTYGGGEPRWRTRCSWRSFSTQSRRPWTTTRTKRWCGTPRRRG